MGLLDFAGTDEGMQGLGLLAAAAPSMAPMNLAGRLAQAAQGYQGLKEQSIKLQMSKLAELRAQQLFEMQKDAYYDSPGGAPGSPSAPMGGSMLGTIPGQPGQVSASMPGQPSNGVPPNNLAAELEKARRMSIANLPGAKDVFEIAKYKNDPLVLGPGINQSRLTGQITTVPTTSTDGKSSQAIPDPTAPGGYRIIAPMGAIETAGAYGDRTKANDLVSVPDGKGGTQQMTQAQAASRYNGSSPAPADSPAPSAPVAPSAPDSGSSGPMFVMGKDGVQVTPQQMMQRIAQIKDPAQRRQSTAIMQQLLKGSGSDVAPAAAVSGPQAPSAPALGGMPGYTPPASQLEADKTEAVAAVNLKTQPGLKSATDLAGGDAANFNDYKKTLNKAVETGYQQYQRNLGVEQLMEAYKTGLPNPEARSAFASTIKNMFPNNAGVKAFAEKVNGGDIGNGQMLANLLSAAGLTSVIRTLDGNGRINKAEFQSQQEHAEKNTSDPNALLGIMRFQNNAFKQDYAEQQALAEEEKGKGANPKTWQADYSKIRMDNLAKPGALPQTPAQASSNPPSSTLTDSLPVANKSNMGKMAIDHQTGAKYRSNGLQWVKQ